MRKSRFADTYHAWRARGCRRVRRRGFCKSATLDEIRKHDYVLTPGALRARQEDDGEPFAKMARLAAQWRSGRSGTAGCDRANLGPWAFNAALNSALEPTHTKRYV